MADASPPAAPERLRLARTVQERVADALAAMCRVEVDAVDVSVEAVE